jgi:hypothetical protein
MIPEKIFETIEDPVYGLKMGLVSTIRLFDEALGEEESARTLRKLLDNPQNREILVDRLMQLLNAENDTQYAHPYDLAIGVYLRLLEKCDFEMAIEPARRAFALDTLWWGRAFAISILNAAMEQTSDAEVVLSLKESQITNLIEPAVPVVSGCVSEKSIASTDGDTEDVTEVTQPARMPRRSIARTESTIDTVRREAA